MAIYDINRRATAVGLYSLEELTLEDHKTTREGVNQALQAARPLMETVYRENLELFREAFGTTVQVDDLAKRSERQVARWLKMYVDGGVVSRLSRMLRVPTSHQLVRDLEVGVF